LFDPAANWIVLRMTDQVFLAGTNSNILGRLYQNSTPSFSGAAEVGSQVGPFGVGDPNVHEFHFDAALVTDAYLFGWMANNTSSNTNGCYVSVLDDVGFSGSLTASGCCHDPMLDLILAAVTRSFPPS
jgi:hypothetical protein